MRMQQRHVFGLVIAVAAAVPAAVQADVALRWRGGANALGLQAAGGETRLPCTSYTLACADSASLPLYATPNLERSLSVQVRPAENTGALPLQRRQGPAMSLVGRQGLVQGFGVYGRVGTSTARFAPSTTTMGAGEGGLTYGVGLSWDFSRRGSAAVGLDSYDIRTLAGEGRELRTSLGLQWRY